MTAGVQRKTFHREIPHRLTDEEIRQHAKRLGGKLQERALLDAKRKALAKDLAGQMATLDSDIERLGVAIDKGEEMRSTECFKELQGSQVFIMRADTGEVIDQQPATFVDQQMEFEIDIEDVSDAEDASNADAFQVMTSSVGDQVMYMPDDGEVPARDIPSVPAKKRGRPKKGA